MTRKAGGRRGEREREGGRRGWSEEDEGGEGGGAGREAV